MSVDNRTQIQDCEDFSGDTWTANAQGGDQILAGLFYEGTGSIETQHSDSLDETWTGNDSAATAIAISMTNSTLYIILKDNLLDVFASGGAQIVIGDGTNRVGYDVGGGDAQGIPLNAYFRSFKLDGEQAAATPGGNNAYAGTEAGLAFGSITQVGFGSLHLSKAQGNVTNAFIDSITHLVNTSYALTVNGGTVGTPETMGDVAGDDITSGWGMLANPLGSQFIIFASTEWGESVASADHYFTATDEQWYVLGDNGGGRPTAAGNMLLRVIGNSTDTGSFVLTRVTIVNTGTVVPFDLSSTNMDTMTFTGCVFTDLSTITLQIQDAGNKFLDTCVFNNCAKVLVSSIDLDDCSFNGTTDADGAILIDEDADTTPGTMTNLTFESDGTGHAVHLRPTGAGPFEYDLDNWVYNGYATDGGTAANRVFYINPVTSTVDITLNIQNGGNVPSVDETGYTGTLTIVNAVTVRVEGVSEGAAITVRAAETVGTITVGDTIFDLLADSSGAAELTTFNYEAAFDPSGLDVTVRVRQQGLPNAALQDDNAVFTDFTAAANSTTTDDMVMYPATPVATEDSFQWGHAEQFFQLKHELSTVGAGGFVITWEYWDGGSWTALSGVVDGTSNLTATGENIVSWTDPGDWAVRTDDSLGPYFYVRARYTSGTMSTVPLGRKTKLDVTRYLPFTQNRIIETTGLTVVATWVEDTIAQF